MPSPAPLRHLADPGHLVRHVAAKVQTAQNGRALLVAYIDARAVAAILDRVLGPEGWTFDLTAPPHTVGQIRPPKTGREPKWPGEWTWLAVGRLSVHLPGRSIYRDDLGTGTGGPDDGGKGAASDALKRCGAMLGVGRALHALERRRVACGADGSVNAGLLAEAVTAWRADLTAWSERFARVADTPEVDGAGDSPDSSAPSAPEPEPPSPDPHDPDPPAPDYEAGPDDVPGDDDPPDGPDPDGDRVSLWRDSLEEAAARSRDRELAR